ncbi:MAG: amino acid ABC transporter permease [Hyphomicrobiales bacterium]|nr:MAG: amino acid ABC transporter permease [Hyphomicrobiales bacterium]
MAEENTASTTEKPKVALLNDPKFRSYIFQGLLLAVIVWFFWGLASNAAHNLAKAGIAQGFGFLDKSAGFGINFSPFIDYVETSSYGTVFWVGLQNTLLIAVIGIILATILGFTVGVARLSSNWVVAKVATVYVEALRNVPLLLQILIWYKGVGALLPSVKNTVDMGAFGQLNTKAWFAPKVVLADGAGLVFGAFVAACVITYFINRWATRRQMLTGQTFPVFLTAIALMVLLPLITYFLKGQPMSLEYATLGRFGPKGGARVIPELMAMLVALTTYTAAFIAEIVRAGILAVPAGQSEASAALGLQRGQALRLVVIPQAMRVIIPPLTSQYLNLTKNSSLAVAIAYPDLMAVFGGTALNQTGQAVEILSMTMLTYLAISLVTAMFMNWYNSRMTLVER